MSKHALIGGGTGFIGQRLTCYLKQQGYITTLISRMPGLERITWHDLEKNGVPKGVTAVINLAGQNVLDPTRRWTDGFKQNVWNSRVITTKVLAKAIDEAPDVKAFVNICGVSHYMPSEQKVYNESDTVKGFNFMSKLCLEWEEAASLSPEAAERCRKTIVRSGVVVGREGGMIENIWLPFKLGLGGPLGTGKQVMPWIHVEDLCWLMMHSIEQSEVEGVLNGVAPEIVTNGEFSKQFASALHRPCIFAVPEFVVQTIFGKDRSALVLSGAKIEPKRTLESGFQYKYPTAKAALAEVVKKS